MPRVMLGMPATLEKNSTRPETAMQRSLSGPITRVRMDEEGEENVHRSPLCTVKKDRLIER